MGQYVSWSRDSFLRLLPFLPSSDLSSPPSFSNSIQPPLIVPTAGMAMEILDGQDAYLIRKMFAEADFSEPQLYSLLGYCVRNDNHIGATEILLTEALDYDMVVRYARLRGSDGMIQLLESLKEYA